MLIGTNVSLRPVRAADLDLQESAGHGYVTEAVQLLVDYLFATKTHHRIQLVIVPENAPSRRIAEKCGFALEGTARGAFFNDGHSQDVLLYSLLRTDPRPWLPPAD
jgi:ribosomal-protein-alanine N-acetyltransferase